MSYNYNTMSYNYNSMSYNYDSMSYNYNSMSYNYDSTVHNYNSTVYNHDCSPYDNRGITSYDPRCSHAITTEECLLDSSIYGYSILLPADVCEGYCQCEWGERAYYMPCSSGLHFNAIMQVCDWPSNAKCSP
ncbi:hypothetical protein B566_EDAN013039 [Ephemera danica]|nr:hypothetical protein B566_EDAN013039 [Ephemera danica]